MYFEHLYQKDPEEYLKMDLDSLSTPELKELSFYLWYKFPEDEKMMDFRDNKVMPRLQDASEEDEDGVDGE